MKQFITSLDSISFNKIKADLINYIKTKPDQAQFEAFFNSATGTTFIELLAGYQTYLSQQTTIARRETYLAYAKNKTSVIGISQSLGYSVDRGHNAKLYLVVQANQSVSLGKWEILGSCKDLDIILLEPIALTINQYYILPVVLGNVNEEDIVVDTSLLKTFRFSSNLVSNDILLFINSLEAPLGNKLVSLVEDKYVTTSNTLGSVDVAYLNRSRDKLIWGANLFYNVGNFIEPSTPNGFIYRCGLYGQVGVVEPTWPTVEGQSTIDNQVLWTCHKDYTYNTSDILKLKYIELNNLNFSIPEDLTFNYGLLQSTTFSNTSFWTSGSFYPVGDYVIPTIPSLYIYRCDASGISAGSEPTWPTIIGNTVVDGTVTWSCVQGNVVSSPFTESEEIESIRINGPLSFANQQLVKSRDDYADLFKTLNPLIVDTNYLDISPAVIELTYVNSDNSLFNSTEKSEILSQLASYRPMGLQPPIISDPIQNNLLLDIIIYIRISGTYDLNTLIANILNSYNNTLELSLDLLEIENQINSLTNDNGEFFIKAARVTVNKSTYATATPYIIGKFVIPTAPNGYMYRCIVSGTSSGVEPAWPVIVGDTVIDNTITWECYEINNLISYKWNEYIINSFNLTVI
jgi:hypothetical protein